MNIRHLKYIALLQASFFACFSVAADTMDAAEMAYESEDFARALEILLPLAEAGIADAQFLLGLMHANGQGVEQNFYRAGKLYRAAGDQGHAGAQVNLGSLFENCYGNGPCNSVEAANWYRRAADQGDAIAQYNLGVMYGIGVGVVEDEWTSRRLFRKAAEQGYAPAQYNLAVTYERGMGGPVDPVAAFAWYDLAADRGYEAGNSSRSKVAAGLSAEELEKATRLSALLKDSY